MTISKKQISLVRSLAQKKYRQQHRLFVAEGEKVVSELLESDYLVQSIFAIEGYEHPGASITRISEKELKQISQLKTPNQVLAVAEMPGSGSAPELKNQLSIALYELNDPGNLGTIIRTADWFGISQILCSQNSVDVFNPKVIQASMGSVFRVKVNYCNLQATLTQNRVPVYVADLEGENIYQTPLPKEAVLLLGSESHGVPEEFIQIAKKVVSIPRKGKAESLNVATAAAIFCSEWGKVNLQK